mgnify:CR=1 FL=1
MEQSLLYLILLYNAAFSYTPIYEKELPEKDKVYTEKIYNLYGLDMLDAYHYKYSDEFKANDDSTSMIDIVYWNLPFFRSMQYFDIFQKIDLRLLMEDAIEDMEYWLNREFEDDQIEEQKQYCLQKYNELLESIVAVDMTTRVSCELYNSDLQENKHLKLWNRKKLYKQTKKRFDTIFREMASKQLAEEMASCEDDESSLSKTF